MVQERVYVDRGISGPGLFFGLLVVVLLAVGVLWATGALTVRQPAGGRVEVTFDASKAEDSTKHAMQKTGKALEHAGQKLERQAQKPDHGDVR
ncbi:MAG TPA: hypothetical protein VFW87_06840 [Pirellulales bacterium]|nr:hypothetical protein [Pirellulales bacterium]